MVTIDHCRIGSLEKIRQKSGGVVVDHCRIGSLENKLCRLGVLVV